MRLAGELGGVVLNKDVIRAALFPPPTLDYSLPQDDLVMAAVYRAATYILRAEPRRVVLLDGRTYLRSYQVRDFLDLASSLHETPILIECVCAEDVVRNRLEQDRASGRHPAANRTIALYREVQARAEPITVPHLTLDTGRLSLEMCVTRCLAYLNGVYASQDSASDTPRPGD